MTKSRGILKPRHAWTAVEIETVRISYADLPTQAIARVLGLPLDSVHRQAYRLGLKKSSAYLASPAACRLRRGDEVGKASRYPKGHAPANKGVRRPGYAPGRMSQTQFKKGQRGNNWMPIGSERISKDGYLERKINDDMPFQRRWRAVHLLMWEAKNGPLPKGHAVAFRNDDKTDLRAENFELITRVELMRRNSIHNLPPELVEVVMLKGRVKRQINKRSKRENQDQRSA
jgi:hypothetical protein